MAPTNARCTALSPEQADALFFPGPGGKPHKAEKYCNDCPVRSQCLSDALKVEDLEGFYCGTTKEDRKKMRSIYNIAAATIADTLPPEPVRSAKKSKYRIVKQVPDTHAWLDVDLEPDLLELVGLVAS